MALRNMDWRQFTLADLSSAVTTVSNRLVLSSFTSPTPYASLWANWPEVEALELIGKLGGNYDAAFIGIYEEEVQMLRALDNKSLEQLHIVPIRPSLLTRPGLKSLEIMFKARDRVIDFPPQHLFLSKLTGILVFNKFKLMGIQFKIFSSRECALHLNHLHQYADIVITED